MRQPKESIYPKLPQKCNPKSQVLLFRASPIDRQSSTEKLFEDKSRCFIFDLSIMQLSPRVASQARLLKLRSSTESSEETTVDQKNQLKAEVCILFQCRQSQLNRKFDISFPIAQRQESVRLFLLRLSLLRLFYKFMSTSRPCRVIFVSSSESSVRFAFFFRERMDFRERQVSMSIRFPSSLRILGVKLLRLDINYFVPDLRLLFCRFTSFMFFSQLRIAVDRFKMFLSPQRMLFNAKTVYQPVFLTSPSILGLTLRSMEFLSMLTTLELGIQQNSFFLRIFPKDLQVLQKEVIAYQPTQFYFVSVGFSYSSEKLSSSSRIRCTFSSVLLPSRLENMVLEWARSSGRL